MKNNKPQLLNYFSLILILDFVIYTIEIVFQMTHQNIRQLIVTVAGPVFLPDELEGRNKLENKSHFRNELDLQF